MEILNETLSAITPQDASWRIRAGERLDQLTMPHWALGRLMDLAMNLVEADVRVLTEAKTFAEAQVSEATA